MHELSIVESLLSVAIESAEKAQASRVFKIYVAIGDLSGVVEDSVNFYFGFLSEKTIAAGATIVFMRKQAKLRCRECEIVFSPEKLDFHCPGCGGQQVDIIGGRELYIDRLEVE
jgi:hydrogenase nickel incorporation protein HypA/HybF